MCFWKEYKNLKQKLRQRFQMNNNQFSFIGSFLELCSNYAKSLNPKYNSNFNSKVYFSSECFDNIV